MNKETRNFLTKTPPPPISHRTDFHHPFFSSPPPSSGLPSLRRWLSRLCPPFSGFLLLLLGGEWEKANLYLNLCWVRPPPHLCTTAPCLHPPSSLGWFPKCVFFLWFLLLIFTRFRCFTIFRIEKLEFAFCWMNRFYIQLVCESSWKFFNYFLFENSLVQLILNNMWFNLELV